MAQNKKRDRKKRHIDWVLWVFALILLGPVVWVVAYRFINPPITVAMILQSPQHIERHWVKLEAISPHLIRAVIAAEDTNFCRHHGFDQAAIEKAWAGYEEGAKLRGASTLSMQTAKNAFLWPGRTWLRKGIEAYFTVLIEWIWPKPRIMEVYLNIAQWGRGLYGAEIAAQHFFNKHAAMLTPQEAARLAAVLPNPEAWSPVSDDRGISQRFQTIAARADIVERDHLAGCVVGK